MSIINFLSRFRKKLKLRLNPRPSKTTFHRLLSQALLDSEPYQSVLDCASAGAKFRWLFNGKKYTGIDIDASLIQAAKQDFGNDRDVILIQDDIRDFRSDVKDMVFDLVVSTHTIAHLDGSEKEIGIDNLICRLKPCGSLIVQCDADSRHAVLRTANGKFATISERKYRGYLSAGFEWLVIKIHAGEGKASVVSGRPNLFRFTKFFLLPLSAVVSYLDRGFGGDHFLIHCRHKLK